MSEWTGRRRPSERLTATDANTNVKTSVVKPIDYEPRKLKSQDEIAAAYSQRKE